MINTNNLSPQWFAYNRESSPIPQKFDTKEDALVVGRPFRRIPVTEFTNKQKEQNK